MPDRLLEVAHYAQALFPVDESATALLTVSLDGAAAETFALKLRVPGWVLPGTGSVTLHTSFEVTPRPL